MNNIVDNLQTKDNLTYNQVYEKLMDLPRKVKSKDDKAYKATASSLEEKGKWKDTTEELECSYCKAHYPKSKFQGHKWSTCNKLKADKEKKEKDKEEKKDKEGKKEETTKPVSEETEAVGSLASSSSSSSPQKVTR